METRSERYTRYRERIKNMSDMEFPRTKESLDSFSAMEAKLSGSAISMPGDSVRSYGLNNSPYRLYLRKQRIYTVLKVIVALLAIGGLVAWYLLMQGRAK